MEYFMPILVAGSYNNLFEWWSELKIFSCQYNLKDIWPAVAYIRTGNFWKVQKGSSEIPCLKKLNIWNSAVGKLHLKKKKKWYKLACYYFCSYSNYFKGCQLHFQSYAVFTSGSPSSFLVLACLPSCFHLLYSYSYNYSLFRLMLLPLQTAGLSLPSEM